MTRTGRNALGWASVVALVAFLVFGVATLVQPSGFSAVSRVLLSLVALEPDETIDQFDALDESDAVRTVVDIFGADDLWQRSLEDAGISSEDGDTFARAISNPRDSLVVVIEVIGPNGRVTPLADSVASLGSADLEAAFPEIVVVAIDAERAQAMGGIELTLAALVGLAAFVATSLMALGQIVVSGESARARSLKDALRAWIAERPRGDAEAEQWPPGRLIGVAAALGLAAGLFAWAPLLGAAAVGGALVALATLFALRHPQWLTVGLVLLVLFRLSDIGTDFFGAPEISIPYALFVLTVVGIRRALLGEVRDGWLGMAIALFALIAVMSVSGLFAADQDIAFDRTFDVVKNGLVGLMMIVLVREIRDLRTVIWTLIGGTSFLSVLGIYSYLAGSVPGMLEGFAQTVDEVVEGVVVSVRIAGPIGDANFFGQLLVTVFPLAFERAWRERSRLLQIVAAAASALIATALVLTNSRGAVVGLAVCLVLLLIWLRPPAFVLVTVVGALALVPFLVPASYLERVVSIGQVFSVGSTTVDPSIQGRTSEFVVGLQMFHDHPMVGVGPGNYPGRYVEYSPEVGLDYRAELRQPHSLPVEVAAEMGILGLTWWFLALVVFGRSISRVRQAARSSGDSEMANYLEALVISLIGFLVTALFLHLDFARFFWMMAGTSVAAVRLARSRQAAEIAPELVRS